MLLPHTTLHQLLILTLLLGAPAMTSTAALSVWWWSIIALNSLIIADALLLLMPKNWLRMALQIGMGNRTSPMNFWRRAGS